MKRNNQPTTNFYITTPIYYINDLPHIGHSYCTIAADCLARYYRLRGHQVLFATGTDEHGQKIVRSATQRGKAPQEFVDEMVQAWKQMWERLHIKYDRFIRTTEPEHISAVQDIFQRLVDSGDIYAGEYQGWYCVPCETYLPEADLQDGLCPQCGRPVESMSEPAYFFRTSKYADRLLRYIEEHPQFIMPATRRNEVLAFIEGGMHDACVSRRRTEWDIPVPADDAQSVYVWLDALVNYLTVAGYGDKQQHQTFANWWPPQVQLIGKDILTRFHATLWPAVLMALELPLPQTIFAHGWWVTNEGDKISKSKGNVLDPYQIARGLVDLSGATTTVAVDSLRYFLLREVPFGLDGSFSWNAILSRFNADLANDLGNLLNRSLPLLERYLGSQIPQPGPGAGELADQIDQTRSAVEQALADIDFRQALTAIWQLIAAANKFLDEREPWNLYKQSKTVELEAVLYDVADCLRVIAIMIAPFMPAIAEEIWEQLGLEAAGATPTWAACRAQQLPPGIYIQRGEPIFPRVDIKRALSRLEGRAASEAEKETKAPLSTTITIQQFSKLELKAGVIVEAHRVPGTDKLLRLLVDIGEDQPRQVVAGLAEQFNPRELLNQQVVIVANLEPATIQGVESQGMILAVGDKEPIALITTDRQCPPGSIVR